MREIIRWLMQDDQKELLEILVAIALNLLFLALIALILWPLQKLTLAFHLAKGYGVLWIVTFVIAVLISRIQIFFRVNLYDHSDAYLISNLAASCILQAGWAAFATLTVQIFLTGTSVWIIVILYLVGAISCLGAFYAVSSFYQGHFYRMVSLPLALVSFIVFSVWPASAQALFGWLFALF